MQRTQFGEMACSIARTLDVAGEPWSPLIIRDVYIGISRFDQLQQSLGISRKVLAGDVQGARDRTGHLTELRPLHTATLAQRVPLGN